MTAFALTTQSITGIVNIGAERKNLTTIPTNRRNEKMKIIATFRNGRTITYTDAVYDLLTTDKEVVKITTETGEILFKQAV